MKTEFTDVSETRKTLAIEIPIDEDLQCIVELVEGNELNPYPYDRV